MKITLRKNSERVLLQSDILILVLFFLSAVNVINREMYFMFAAFACFLFFRNRITVTLKMVPVWLFSVSLLIFQSAAQQTITTALSVFAAPLCFMVGYDILANQKSARGCEYAFLAVTGVLAGGTWLHMMLNAGTNLGSLDRNTTDFWTGEVRSATGQAGLGVLMVGLTVAILFSDMRRRNKVIAFCALMAVHWYNLTLAGRTLIVMTIIALLVAFLFRFQEKHGRNALVIIAVLTAVVIVWWMYSSDVFGIQTLVEESNLFQRFRGDTAEEMAESSRFEYKMLYLKYLLEYPLGGQKIHGIVGHYAHDLYLDTYDEAGVFAFVFIVIIVVQSLFALLRLLKSKRCSYNTKQMALCVMLCLNMEFWIEPILAGFDWMIAFYCMIYGGIAGMLSRPSEEPI